MNKNQFEWEGKTISTGRRVEYIDGVPHVECRYLKRLLPISDFRLKRYKETYNIDRSRTGEREQSYREKGYKPKEAKEKVIDGETWRMCNILKAWRPISEFWQHMNNLEGKMYYSAMCREGKKVENERYKESTKIAIARWKQNNPDKRKAEYARRRAAKRQALPRWLTLKHHEDVEKVYEEARHLTETTGHLYHVHHIYPLHGEDGKGNHISCGLHVPWNLMPLTRTVNCQIGRRNPEYHDHEMRGL